MAWKVELSATARKRLSYRVICSLEDDRLLIMVLRVGHRKEIYSR